MSNELTRILLLVGGSCVLESARNRARTRGRFGLQFACGYLCLWFVIFRIVVQLLVLNTIDFNFVTLPPFEFALLCVKRLYKLSAQHLSGLPHATPWNSFVVPSPSSSSNAAQAMPPPPSPLARSASGKSAASSAGATPTSRGITMKAAPKSAPSTPTASAASSAPATALAAPPNYASSPSALAFLAREPSVLAAEAHDLAARSWILIQESMKTPLCVFHPPQIIALGLTLPSPFLPPMFFCLSAISRSQHNLLHLVRRHPFGGDVLRHSASRTASRVACALRLPHRQLCVRCAGACAAQHFSAVVPILLPRLHVGSAE